MRDMKAETLAIPLLLAVPACDLDCEDHTIPVSMEPGGPVSFHVSGTLCSEGDPAGKDIEILFHPPTANRSFWDGLGQGPQYSYVAASALHGRATFAYDSIGAGASSLPDALTVTQDAADHVGEQVFDHVMGGGLGHSFGKVGLVGHAGASLTATHVADVREADALMLIGFAHTLTPEGEASFDNIWPAMLDPKFAGVIADPNYLTSVPGERAAFLFNESLTTPSMLAADEAGKDLFAAGLAMSFPAATLDPLRSLSVTEPTYMLLGSEDLGFCGGSFVCGGDGFESHEAAFWSNGVDTEVVESFGNGILFQVNSGEVLWKMSTWMDVALE